MNILVHHEPHELRMLGVVIEGVADVLLQRLFGAHRLIVGRGLARADLRVRLLEHRTIQLLLAAEVVIDHPLRRVDLVGYLVDASARESLVGELLGSDVEDVESYLLCFAVPVSWVLLSWSRQALAPGETAGMAPLWCHCREQSRVQAALKRACAASRIGALAAP